MAPVAALSAISASTAAQDRASTATPEHAPLKVDVVKADDGVFVYTLTDPGSGAVLAVIPRESVRADRDGRNVDQKV